MSRLLSISARATAAVGLLLLVGAVVACDEDGKTAPERCADPALPIYDIQTAGEPGDDNAKFPCVTPIGHAVSYVIPAAGTGGNAGSGGTAGSGSAGKAVSAGKAGSSGAGGK